MKTPFKAYIFFLVFISGLFVSWNWKTIYESIIDSTQEKLISVKSNKKTDQLKPRGPASTPPDDK